MRDITHCPNCQTQFFVSEDQLNQHGGLVRCGQCLHVFNAKEQFVAQPSTDNPILEESPSADNAASVATLSVSEQTNTQTSSSWPTLDQNVITEAPSSLGDDQNQTPEETQPPLTSGQDQAVEAIELSAVQEAVSTFNALDNTNVAQTDSSQPSNDTATYLPSSEIQPEAQQVNDITKLSFIAGNQSNHFNDVAKHTKLDGIKIVPNRYHWLWALGTFILLLIAAGQSVYFLRNTIAIHYPNLKPYLLQACQSLDCSIDLPQQIEWIIIDDSDMQEDLEHVGVMHLSSSLFNKAGFVQAYPNVELTLTDTNDVAVLRRIFKPAEYLPPNTDISAGFSAGKEIKVKLAITTQDVSVAGYRLYVTY
jgi:predicted Zn finger-like uncharacterized protein